LIEISIAAAVAILAVLGGRVFVMINRRLNDHAERIAALESVSRIQRKTRRRES
jgi:hypothetical protein